MLVSYIENLMLQPFKTFCNSRELSQNKQKYFYTVLSVVVINFALSPFVKNLAQKPTIDQQPTGERLYVVQSNFTEKRVMLPVLFFLLKNCPHLKFVSPFFLFCIIFAFLFNTDKHPQPTDILNVSANSKQSLTSLGVWEGEHPHWIINIT